MGEHTGIQWADHTWNPWRGCTRVSEGCRHCYAETLSHCNTMLLGAWGPKGHRTVAAESSWEEPRRWNERARRQGVRARVFCASLADVFEDWDGEVLDTHGQPLWYVGPGKWTHAGDMDRAGPLQRLLTLDDVRSRVFQLAYECQHLDWLFLTKRPEQIKPLLSRAHHLHHPHEDWWSLQQRATRYNWWFGVSVENQQRAEERIPVLLDVPAEFRFLSCEPLLAPLALEPWLGDATCPGIDWVIVGGESGVKARPCETDWIQQLVDQCRAAEVPCFVKQLGAHVRTNTEMARIWGKENRWLRCVGNPREGFLVGGIKDSHGGDPGEWPECLRVQQFPEVPRA